MRQTSSAAFALLVLAGVALATPGAAMAAEPAQTAAPQREIPQSLIFEHGETLDRLTALAKRPGKVGAAASRALGLFKRHTAREMEYILPPLALLPDMADGKVTPDMAWALVMCDRVKADREQIFQEHTQVTDAMNALLVAGEEAHDQDAIEFARSAAGDSLNDIEVLEPTVLLIGDYLRSRLPTAH